MAEAPTTRPSLLVRLRDLQDREAWDQFVELYAPLIYGYARRKGLQDADAADLTQCVLRRVAVSMERFQYDQGRGSFRGWLFTLVRHQFQDFRTTGNGLCRGSGDPALHHVLEAQPAPSEEESAAWEREYRQGLFAWAAGRIRPAYQETTWQAFWRTAVEGQRAKEVAESLGLSVAAVYLARSRVMARLRAEIRPQLNED